MTRRTSVATAAALAIASVGAVGALVSPAAAAGLGTATPSPASIPNTATAQTVSVTASTPSIAYVLGTSAQIVGPGSLTDKYAGTATTKAAGGTSSTFTTKFDLVTAGGLPAAPGSYELDGCTVSCALPIDSGTITVTGAAPAPGAPAAPFVIAAGANAAIAIPGHGFARDEAVSIPRPGGNASDVTFTENTDTSKATSLAGTLAVGASVPAGAYDLKVTDPADQTGYCASCLEVTSGTASGPGPVHSLSAVPITASAATISWKPPTTGTTPTSYKVVVSKTSTSATDAGLTVTVDQTNHDASVTGLSGSTTYFVTVTASDGTTTGPPAIASLNTPNPSGLSLRVSRTSVVSGSEVKLSGVLVHSVGSNPSSGLAGQSVVISAKSDNGTVKKVGTTTTGPQGNYRFTAFPTTDTRFGAFFAGATESKGAPDSAAVSNAFPKVSVASLVVGAAQHPKIGRHAKSVLVLGFVAPKQGGRNVTLVRIDGRGGVHTVGHATLTGSSHYAVRGRVPKTRGVYSYQVRIAQRVGNVAGKSATIHVRRA